MATQLAEIGVQYHFAGGLQHNIVLVLLLYTGIQIVFRKSPHPKHGLPWWLSSNLPAIQETWIPSLGREDPLEEGMATHSSILAWKISWTEVPGRLQSMGSQRVGHD